MSVQVNCPHCNSVCQVDERFLGSPLQCGRCRKPFTVEVPAAEEADEDDVSLDWDAPGAAARMDSSQSASHSHPAASAPGAAAPPALRRLDIGSATSVGRVREHNEDSFLVQQASWCNMDQRRDLALVVVADGVGGYQAGDQASGLLIRVVGNQVAPLLTGTLTGQVKDMQPAQLAQALDQALRTANATIHQRAQSNPACKGMASTVVAALIWDGELVIGLVGDCRVYHWRNPQLTQVTRDQTLVNRMIDLGQISPQQAEHHPARNEVLQAVGRHNDVTPASYQLRIAAGDWLVICCDGMYAHVDNRMLETALRQCGPSAGLLASHLVDLANQGGGSDNCTVVAVRCY